VSATTYCGFTPGSRRYGSGQSSVVGRGAAATVAALGRDHPDGAGSMAATGCPLAMTTDATACPGKERMRGGRPKTSSSIREYRSTSHCSR